MKSTLISSFVLGALLFSLQIKVFAAVVIDDQFNDSVLDSAWTQELSDALAWEYSENSGSLNVSNVQSSVTNNASGGTWGIASIGQSFDAVADFNSSMAFSWGSDSSNNAMQGLLVSFYGTDNNLVARAGYFDGWVKYSGAAFAEIEGKKMHSGYGSQALAGNGQVDISRSGGNMVVNWNGQELLSDISNSLLTRVEIEFWNYAFNDGADISLFGDLNVDSFTFSGETTSVPEPSSAVLLGLGMLGVFLRRRNLKAE